MNTHEYCPNDCKFLHRVTPSPMGSSSNPGLGCLNTGGRALQKCDAYKPKPEPTA